MSKTAKEYYISKFKEYIPEYYEENMEELFDLNDTSDEAILFRTNFKIMLDFAEQEAKAAIKYVLDFISEHEVSQTYVDYHYEQFKLLPEPPKQ